MIKYRGNEIKRKGKKKRKVNLRKWNKGRRKRKERTKRKNKRGR